MLPQLNGERENANTGNAEKRRPAIGAAPFIIARGVKIESSRGLLTRRGKGLALLVGTAGEGEGDLGWVGQGIVNKAGVCHPLQGLLFLP